jgi:flavin reductase (DIM6/NTAB) family NADH-FMN oxidoreductase RutF
MTSVMRSPSTKEPPMSVTRDTFFSIMGSFPSGVTVVTTIGPDALPAGLTSSAMCSVSAEPPLLLISVAKSSRTLPVLRLAGRFAVNVLHEDAVETSACFASRDRDKFRNVTWRLSARALPILHRDAIAYAECELEQEVEAGDHVLLLGHVLDGGVADPNLRPLVYFRRSYGTWQDSRALAA